MRYASDSKGNRYRVDSDGKLIEISPKHDLRQENNNCCGKNKLPSATNMLKGLTAATALWAKKGFALVDENERTTRFTVCTTCEYLTEEKRCMKCGCFMEIKSKLAGMKCPVDKW